MITIRNILKDKQMLKKAAIFLTTLLYITCLIILPKYKIAIFVTLFGLPLIVINMINGQYGRKIWYTLNLIVIYGLFSQYVYPIFYKKKCDSIDYICKLNTYLSALIYLISFFFITYYMFKFFQGKNTEQSSKHNIKKVTFVKIAMIFSIITVNILYFLLPRQIQNYFSITLGSDGLGEGIMVFFYLIIAFIYLIYFLGMTKTSGRFIYLKSFIFIITYLYYLSLTQIAPNIMVIYNPILFIPLLLSFSSVFLHSENFKFLLVVFIASNYFLVLILRIFNVSFIMLFSSLY